MPLMFLKNDGLFNYITFLLVWCKTNYDFHENLTLYTTKENQVKNFEP